MDVKIYPSKLIGTLNAPSSKSYSHRMIIAAALAGGISEISNVTGSNDIKVTAGAMEALGADVLADGDVYTVRGIKDPAAKADIDCGESGSTLRFMLPVACALGAEATFVGQGRLGARPLSPLSDEIIAAGCDLQSGRFSAQDERTHAPGHLCAAGKRELTVHLGPTAGSTAAGPALLRTGDRPDREPPVH